MTGAQKERARIERLMWRAGFGERSEVIARMADTGLNTTVDNLLTPRGRSLKGAPGRVDGQPIDPRNEYGHDVLWWLDRAVRTQHPLVERMTLNWHDHFATSNAEVGEPKLMLRQYATLRRNALGRFDNLAREMVKDPAMQLFLSLANSSKDEPNENFAREFLELFTLGVNNGYTEKDIREAARAFTGFTYDYDTGKFGYDAAEHDNGVKTILGKKGRFEPLDVVDIAINHPNHAEFLCRKLWRYFSPQPLSRGLLSRMVRVYRSSGTNVKPVLRLILTSPALYRDLANPDMIKPPFVYAAGMLRLSRKGVTMPDWRWMLEQMGQVPFYPPNVAGWNDGTAWLSSNAILARYGAASALLGSTIKDGSITKRETPKQALASAGSATGNPWASAATRRALDRYARTALQGRDDEPDHWLAERQRGLRHLLLAGPDAQVC